VFFWEKSPCGSGFKLSFRPWRWKNHDYPKLYLLLTNPHGEVNQKNIWTVYTMFADSIVFFLRLERITSVQNCFLAMIIPNLKYACEIQNDN
jgi:hypothetical protein